MSISGILSPEGLSAHVVAADEHLPEVSTEAAIDLLGSGWLKTKRISVAACSMYADIHTCIKHRLWV